VYLAIRIGTQRHRASRRTSGGIYHLGRFTDVHQRSFLVGGKCTLTQLGVPARDIRWTTGNTLPLYHVFHLQTISYACQPSIVFLAKTYNLLVNCFTMLNLPCYVLKGRRREIIYIILIYYVIKAQVRRPILARQRMSGSNGDDIAIRITLVPWDLRYNG
jgi:hypothetical protein